MKETKATSKKNICLLLTILLALGMVLSNLLFFGLYPDNLMHSDMAAEVLLSKLLSQTGGIMTSQWCYSTELRVVYSQLIMTPLFCVFSDFFTVKMCSVVIFSLLLAVVWYVTAGEFLSGDVGSIRDCKKIYIFLGMALLFASLSNEYLDMMFLGNFYTSQVICTYLVLKFFLRDSAKSEDKQSKKQHAEKAKQSKKQYAEKAKQSGSVTTEKPARNVTSCVGAGEIILLVILSLSALILGLSGLRYLASLFVPLFLAVCLSYGLDPKSEQKANLPWLLLESIALCVSGTLGMLINKLVLADIYTFDTQSVSFVALSDVPARFTTSLTTILEFVGYRQVEVMTGLGIVNALRFVFLAFLIYVVVYLSRHRYQVLDAKQRLLLYYFYGLLALNWFLLIFTDVLQQYRYWIPVYVVLLLLVMLYLQKAKEKTPFILPVCTALVVVTILSTLYAELWQDTKYNDCEKRYGYMEFLEENGYTFGYATFWNSSVTEYLSGGTIAVAHVYAKEDSTGAAPYAWLIDKDYYTEGYHTGKTFLLLAVTEEIALYTGDIDIMQDATKVYEDAYYVIYEGEGMYLFLEE